MKSVGVRELRQRASALLRLVEGGQSVQVTDRGRPVAILGPLSSGRTPLEQLRAEGEVSAPRGALGDLPPPLVVEGTSGSPSAVLDRLRRRER